MERRHSAFATRLNELCAARWPGGSRNANAEIASAVSTSLGRPVGTQYIWRLRTERIRKPDYAMLSAIASYFEVPVDYFDEADLAGSPDPVLSESMRRHGLAVAGLRSSELSQEAVEELDRLLGQAAEVLRREQR
jgi:transcriptional regulator with XRE-family HTH domain